MRTRRERTEVLTDVLAQGELGVLLARDDLEGVGTAVVTLGRGVGMGRSCGRRERLLTWAWRMFAGTTSLR